MSDKKDTDLEQAFSQWLEGKTTQSNQDIEQADFTEQAIWQQRQTVANHLAHHVDVSEEQPVPNWDRAATFEQDKTPWWQWRGLPALSMAFSCFAIALVLLKVELVVQPEGIMLSFAGSQQKSQDERLAQLVDQKLQTFASEQQVVLANYAADIKVKQQETNLQLASYIMGASRQERKEDMNDFIKYINEQRADERFTQNMKLKQLEQAIKYQNTSLTTKPDNLGLQSQPADWTTEE